MTRGDAVAAEICKNRGLEAAMELFFLMKRVYPPYYKWTYHAMSEIDDTGISEHIETLARAACDFKAWENRKYDPKYLNMNDAVVLITEKIAGMLLKMMKDAGLTEGTDPYLEVYVEEMLKG